VLLLDTSTVTVEHPEKSIRSFDAGKPKRILTCDVLIIGGGIGGVAAAQKIWNITAKNGKDPSTQQAIFNRAKPLSVIMVEETDWLGGQMTAQGVSALDENYLVDTSGSTLSYQRLRKAIRDAYKQGTRVVPDSLEDPYFNPGNCWVSYLAFEPKIALQAINSMLQPAIDHNSLKVLYRSKAFRVNRASVGGLEPKIASVDFADFVSGETFTVRPKICLDATELGDVVALANYDYSTGSDSRAVTGEPHAPEVGNPENVQDFTYPFVIELRNGTKNSIDKPALFDEFEKQKKFSLLGYKMFAPVRIPDSDGTYLPFWEYRRLIDATNFEDPNYANDLAVINWESNDLREFNIIDQTPAVQAEHLARGKLVSLGFLYWLQNRAPRDEGGEGYSELLLRHDILGTTDGLSKFPYIRESRRVKSKKTIVEQDIVSAFNLGARAKFFSDSMGIGFYPVDIHGRQEVAGAGQKTKPFQIPLGGLIPFAGGNLLPACKNIGTTHITNGAYRLHPVEWAIGEAQGALAAYALASKLKTSDLCQDTERLRTLQRLLVESGVPLYWYDDVPTDHEHFAAIQLLGVLEIMPGRKANLSFGPDQKLSHSELAQALSRLFFRAPFQPSATQKIADLPTIQSEAQALQTCVDEGLLKLDDNNSVYASRPVTIGDLRAIAASKFVDKTSKDDLGVRFDSGDSRDADSIITRAEAAEWLYILATSKQYFGHF
jgi:hypothetical protein